MFESRAGILVEFVSDSQVPQLPWMSSSSKWGTRWHLWCRWERFKADLYFVLFWGYYNFSHQQKKRVFVALVMSVRMDRSLWCLWGWTKVCDVCEDGQSLWYLGGWTKVCDVCEDGQKSVRPVRMDNCDVCEDGQVNFSFQLWPHNKNPAAAARASDHRSPNYKQSWDWAQTPGLFSTFGQFGRVAKFFGLRGDCSHFEATLRLN